MRRADDFLELEVPASAWPGCTSPELSALIRTIFLHRALHRCLTTSACGPCTGGKMYGLVSPLKGVAVRTKVILAAREVGARTGGVALALCAAFAQGSHGRSPRVRRLPSSGLTFLFVSVRGNQVTNSDRYCNSLTASTTLRLCKPQTRHVYVRYTIACIRARGRSDSPKRSDMMAETGHAHVVARQVGRSENKGRLGILT